MKLSLILLLVTFAGGVSSHMPTVYEFCSHVVSTGDGGRLICDASQCQGRPGKLGPAGPRGVRGLKGVKGEQGTSENLEDRVKELEDSLERLRGIIRESHMNQGPSCYMGMKSRAIPDSAITASSNYVANYDTRGARLDTTLSGHAGAWCAKQNRVGEWIQVDLGQTKLVAGVVTQGRSDADQWIRTFKVACGTAVGNIVTVTESGSDKVFTGNNDRNGKVANMLQQPMNCRYVRIYPQTWQQHISMRFEILRGDCPGF